MPRDVYLPDPDDSDAVLFTLVSDEEVGPKRDRRKVEYRYEFRGDPLGACSCLVLKDGQATYRVTRYPEYTAPHCNCPWALNNPESPKRCKHGRVAVAGWVHFDQLRRLSVAFDGAGLNMAPLITWEPGQPLLALDQIKVPA